ncbi:hypothetical protein BC936DRAFT_148627 [Jimgerdemannia flammicorona]|uniref:Uncharacterized protein n=1 Tax=Jimgerdemannia flammicorona TaxID=994334 RepID=A0A433D2M6_9FUNG|nr:hypothetical protein BC936DRAFT_148627 [Jimgerdemannia flammicorona]
MASRAFFNTHLAAVAKRGLRFHTTEAVAGQSSFAAEHAAHRSSQLNSLSNPNSILSLPTSQQRYLAQNLILCGDRRYPRQRCQRLLLAEKAPGSCERTPAPIRQVRVREHPPEGT